MGTRPLTRSVFGRYEWDAPGDRLISLPDQLGFCLVKGSCYHHQPLHWGNLRLVTGLSVWLSPFTSLSSVPIHLTQNFHHNASRASRVCVCVCVGLWAPFSHRRGALDPWPSSPLSLPNVSSSEQRVGCYLVTLLREDALSRNEPSVPRDDEIEGCVVFVLQGPDDKNF